MVDVQMADHRLMSSAVMMSLFATGFELAMMRIVVSNRMTRIGSADVSSTVVAT